MKKWIVLLFLFCIQSQFVCSANQEFYFAHIDHALNAYEGSIMQTPDLRQKVEDLLLQIYVNEQAAHPDDIQCLTAQDSRFYAYQVIAKVLYRKLYGYERENFEFLRFPTQNLLKNREEFFSRYPSLSISKQELAQIYKTRCEQLEEEFIALELKVEEEFLKLARGEEEERNEDEDNEENEEELSRFQLNDTHPDISRELISVNFTMETYRPLDSALFVFLSGSSVSLASISEDEGDYQDKLTRILHELFASLPISQEKLAHSIERLIQEAPRTKVGIINQIFIPKKNASKCMYLSPGGGFLHPIYDDKFEASLREFQNNRDEECFRTFRNFQARIIAGALFEDPEIKIFRYTLIPKEEERQYEKVVQEIIEELLKF